MADQFTPTPVKGLKTNNNDAPAADLLGALIALANENPPANVEGNLVLLSADLDGNLRTKLDRGHSAGAPLYVVTDASPGTPIIQSDSGSAIAAGADDTLVTADLGGTSNFLRKVTLSASVRWKAIVQSTDGVTPVDVVTLFGDAYASVQWTPAQRDAVPQAGGVGNKYQVVMTNMDNLLAADLYATFEHEEIA